MACENKEMAERVALYQELGEADRRAVDEHAARCRDCARDLALLQGFVTQLGRIGEQVRAAAAHPPEETVVQFAVDPRLLPRAAASHVKRHLDEDHCAQCKKVYASIKELEAEAAAKPWAHKPGGKPAAGFWQRYALSAQVLLAAATLLLVLALPAGVYILSLKNQVASLKEEQQKSLADLEDKDRALTGREVEAKDLRGKLDALAGERRQQEIAMAELRRPPVLPLGAEDIFLVPLSTSRAGGEAWTIEWPPGTRYLFFQYRVSPEQTFKRVRWVITDKQGKTVWQKDQARGAGELLMQPVGRDVLRPGETYVLRIYNLGDGQKLFDREFRLSGGR